MPSSIFIYDGVSENFDTEIGLAGNIGPLFVDNGTTYVFYSDPTSTGGYKLGYVYGNQISELCSFSGALPTFGQVTKYKNLITWVSGDKIWAFGSADQGMTRAVYKLADGGEDYVGALAAPFGTPLVASWDGASAYKLNKFYGYDVNAYWYSMMFPRGKCTLQSFTVYFETLTAGARCDFSIVTDNGRNTYTGFSLTETTLNSKDFNIGAKINHNFRIQISWANGSATYPVKINRIEFNILKDDD